MGVTDAKAVIEKMIRDKYPDWTDWDFRWDEVTWKLAQVTFDPFDPKAQEPTSFMQTEWTNCTTAEDGQDWTQSSTTTDTYEYSFTKGLKLGEEVQVGTNVELFDSSVKLTLELDLSTTKTKSISVQKARGIATHIKVPPCTHLTAHAMVYKGTFRTSFTLRVEATGPFGYRAKTGGGAWVSTRTGLTIEDYLHDTFGADSNVFEAQGSLGAAVGYKTAIETHADKPVCNKGDQCYDADVSPRNIHIDADVLSGVTFSDEEA